MAHSNGKKATITVCATNIPGWTNEVLSYLTDMGYHLDWVSNVEECRNAAADRVPDAIITVSATDSTDIARMLHDEATFNHRPLHVFITDNPSVDLSDEQADMILPPSPQFIERQLQMTLGLHQEIDDLNQQVLSLKNEIANITKSMKKQQRLFNEVEVLKNAIVRNVSHELKTPLLHVKSAVALIAEDVDDEKLVSYAKNATGRLEALVKNITLLSSGLDTNLVPVIVRDAAEYAKRNLGRIWQHHGDVSRIEFQFKKNLPPVTADKQGLTTVFQLLFDNALKFSNGEVRVWAEVIDNRLQINIEDHGIGIAPEQLDTIFESFYQVDGSSIRRYGGIGIGLAIVSLILEHHDTKIHIDSTVGKGSVFSFTLPQVEL